MGMCLPCLSGEAVDYDDGEDPATRRAQQAAAAERRQQENESRGLKDPEAVKQKLKKKEELEKREREAEAAGKGGDTGLRWTVD